MNTYKQHGRAATAPMPPRTTPPPLSDAEKLAVSQRVALVKEHLPEAMEGIKRLHELGMIDGLRSIVSVITPDGVTYGNS